LAGSTSRRFAVSTTSSSRSPLRSRASCARTRLFGGGHSNNFAYGDRWRAGCRRRWLPGYRNRGAPQGLSAELANRRLATIAIIGIFLQDGFTDSAWGDWALYMGSNLRPYGDRCIAVGGLLGLAGMSASGHASDYKRLREVRLEHGCSSMFTTIGGYNVLEYTRLSGDLSPSCGLKFSDVPNGFAALFGVPALAGATSSRSLPALSASCATRTSTATRRYGAGFLGLMSIGHRAAGAFQMRSCARGDWAPHTASPLHASEQELGLRPPVGFWDPQGYTKDSSVESFKRCRATEVRHAVCQCRRP